MQRGDSDNLEEADLRLKRTMEMEKEATSKLRFSELQYENGTSLLQALRNEHTYLKQSDLYKKVNNFQTTPARLNALASAAQTAKSSTAVPQTKKIKGNEGCSQSKHLFQIFSQTQKDDEERKIQQLQQRLSALYNSIGKCVEEELLSEKVIGRIKKESRRAAKIKTVQLLQREIGKYKGWLQDSKERVKNDLDDKEVEQKVMHNLESLKQLMGKKVISNDFAYDQLGEEAHQLHRLVEKIDYFREAMKAKSLQYSKALQQCLTQSQTSVQQASNSNTFKSSIPFNPRQITSCIEHVHSLIHDLDQYDTTLATRCQDLQVAVDLVVRGR